MKRSFLFRYSDSTDRLMYRLSWIALGAVLVWVSLQMMVPGWVDRWIGPCLFRMITGYYCPGCGGTRAANALLHGRVLESICYHPFVVYAVVVGGGFWLSQLLCRISKGKIRGMHFCNLYFVLAVVLYLVNFAWKNAMIIWENVYLLG